MNLKKALLAFGFLVMIAPSVPLCAQTGCDDSPEDPTIVLALVGGVGVLVARTRAIHNRTKYPNGFDLPSDLSK